MKHLFIAILLLLGLLPDVRGQNCSDTILLSITSTYEAQELVVRIQAKNFTDISSFQMGIQYDADMVRLLDMTSPIPQFGASSFADYGNGNLRLLWFDPSNDGISLPDQSDFLTLRFIVIQEASFSFLRITESLFPLEFVDRNGQERCVKTSNLDISSAGFSLSGRIWNDVNKNCEADDNETGMTGWLLEISGNGKTYYRTTDGAGNYVVVLPAGNYRTKAYPLNNRWSLCDDSRQFDLMADLTNQDFIARELESCPSMTTQISAPYLLQCDTMPYALYYENKGTATASNARIEVSFDPSLTFIQTDFNSYTINQQTITFNLGDVAPFERGFIKIDFYLDCQNTLKGQTHCVTAKAFPYLPCSQVQGWSGAELSIQSDCDLANGKAIFTLTNTGTGPMLQTKTYIVTEDDVLTPPEPVQLESQQSLTLEFPADGTTYRLTAQQDNGLPFVSKFVTKALEGCQVNGQQPISQGYVTMYEESDRDPFIDTDCNESTDVVLGNAISGQPKGYGTQKWIEKDIKLEYNIRFQHTGQDTAYTVLIKNPISPLLDMTTLDMGAASHPYQYRINQQRELIITFDSLALVSKTTNEAGSFGFVKYSIYPNAGIPDGTLIQNDIKVYFDYAVPENGVGEVHTIGSEFFVVSTLWESAEVPVTMYPNPAGTDVYLQGAEDLFEQGAGYRIFNMQGMEIRSGKVKGTDKVLRLDHLSPGAYVIKLHFSSGEQVALRLVKQ